MRRAPPVCAAAAAALVLALWAGAEEPAGVPQPTPERPALVLAKIHADWCLPCMRLDTTWTQLERRLGDGVELLVLDVTDDEATEQARALAAEQDVAAYFEKYRTQTGTVALLRRGVQEPLQFFVGELDPEPYVAAISDAAGQLIAERTAELPPVSAPPPEAPAATPAGPPEEQSYSRPLGVRGDL